MWLLQLQNCTANSFNKLYLSRNLIVSTKRKANEFHVFILFVNVNISINDGLHIRKQIDINSRWLQIRYTQQQHHLHHQKKTDNMKMVNRELKKKKIPPKSEHEREWEMRWMKNWKIHIESMNRIALPTHTYTKQNPALQKRILFSIYVFISWKSVIFQTSSALSPGCVLCSDHLKINYTCIFLIRNGCFENPLTWTKHNNIEGRNE